MEITLDALIQGKPTIIKDKTYLSTRDYVEPFLSQVSKYTNKFICKVQPPKQLTISNQKEDITYNKVWIQAILPNNDVYGFVYALDVKTPIYKVYRAYLDPNTRLTRVFDINWLQVGTLSCTEKPNFSIDNLMSATSTVEMKSKILSNTTFCLETKDINEFLGKCINRSLIYEYKSIGGKVKLSPNNIIKAYQATFNNLEKVITWESFYNALCKEINDDKDLVNIFEKTLLIGMLFDLVDND